MEIENHPIPQDITGFQFKLIGNMTIKQFAYLASGFIVAWVIYISPLFFIVKIIIALLSASAGAILAFLPIEGRPVDLMIVNFIKAVFKPTQYVYQQSSTDLAEKELKSIHSFNKKRQTISEMSDKQLQEFLTTLPKGVNKLDKKEMVFFNNVNQYQTSALSQTLPGYVPQHAFANSTPAQAPIPAPTPAQSLPPLPQPVPEQKPTILTPQAPNDVMQKSTSILQKELQEAKAKEILEETADSKQFLEAHQKVLELQKNLGDMQLQKQQLEEKLTQLQKQMSAQGQQVYSQSVAKPQPQQQTKLVRSIPQNMTKSVGLVTAPQFPNVISGIVKDPRGNPLSNILVEVKDSQGNAVRAFKTNALGQFISATALTNGDYTIEFEDAREQNRFDTTSFKATGEIILPIEVISVDTREELRRSLFN